MSRYRVTESGSALHMPGCTTVADAVTPVRELTLAQARRWLNEGDRRFCCARCMPADPRRVRLVT